jgi:hypothetical protein
MDISVMDLKAVFVRLGLPHQQQHVIRPSPTVSAAKWVMSDLYLTTEA